MDPELIAYLDRRFDEVNDRVDRGFRDVDRRFQEVDRRFQDVDRRFQDVDRRFEQNDGRFEAIDRRMSKVEILLEAMDDKIGLVADGVLANTEVIRELRVDMDRRLTKLEAR